MAYTGILVRGLATFSDMVADPAILREIALAGRALTVGIYDGSGGVEQVYLNLGLLSRIGAYDNSGGVAFPGFKTSELAINYDGDGYIKQGADHVLLAGLHKFYYASAGVKSASIDQLVLTNGSTEVSIDIGALEFSQSTADSMTLSASDATVYFTQANTQGFILYNETTGTFLGKGTASGDTVTFQSNQVAGDVISVVLHDANYNYSSKIKGTV